VRPLIDFLRKLPVILFFTGLVIIMLSLVAGGVWLILKGQPIVGFLVIGVEIAVASAFIMGLTD